MRIVQIAAIGEAVPPEKYGGIELVVSNITEGMVAKGHEVYLLAAGDSHTSANLKPLIPQSLHKMHSGKDLKKWHSFYHLKAIADILDVIHELKPDVVHNHLTWQLIMFSRFIPCPMFTTVHGPIGAFYERTTYQSFPQSNYVSVSDSQRSALPELNWVKTIYNGIELDKYLFDKESQRDYFVFLGRMSPDKGISEIVQMIKKTNHRLKIAAKIDQVDQEYYESQVEPYIDGDQIEFLGEVDQHGKNELFRHAIALLQYLNWEEPFSLAAVESMACGVPVIVNPRGCMPELVVDGKTGCFFNTTDEMQQCLNKVLTIDRQTCREHVKTNFSAERMVDEYLALAYDLYTNGE